MLCALFIGTEKMCQDSMCLCGGHYDGFILWKSLIFGDFSLLCHGISCAHLFFGLLQVCGDKAMQCGM